MPRSRKLRPAGGRFLGGPPFTLTARFPRSHLPRRSVLVYDMSTMAPEMSKPKKNSLFSRFAKPFRRSDERATQSKSSSGQPSEELAGGSKAGPLEEAPQSIAMSLPPSAAAHPSPPVALNKTSPLSPGAADESGAISVPNPSTPDNPVPAHADGAAPPSSAANNSTISADSSKPEPLIVPLDPITIDETKRSKSDSQLTDAIVRFKTTYTTFVQKNSQFIQLDESLEGAFSAAQAECDIRQGAKKFSDGIWAVLETIQKKRELAEENWTTKLGNVLIKLYPVARLSLSLLGAIGDVLAGFEG